MEVQYQRLLLKLSGEALAESSQTRIGFSFLQTFAEEISSIYEIGIEIALVVGGGNLFRGKKHEECLDRMTGDQIGMLATVMNALAMQEVFEANDMETRVMSALSMPKICEDYIRRRAVRHLEKKRIVIFAAGTGNPYFTTDTAASLRAAEIDADIVLKATKVDGIYSEDPMQNPHAERFESLSYRDVLQKNIGVMDTTSIVLCEENDIPIRVFDMTQQGALLDIVYGGAVGTLVAS